MASFVDKAGLARFWEHVKQTFVPYEEATSTSISPGSGMTIVTGTYQPTVRKEGDVVTVEGALRNKSTRTSTAAFTIGTIPAGYRPAQNVYRIQRCGTGSAPRMFDLVINTSGAIQCAAILDPSASGAVVANAQEAFYIGCSYMVANPTSSMSSAAELMNVEETLEAI